MKDFKEILEKIAKENGTTPENVLQEMQRAIDEAYDHHDASAQPLWDMLNSGFAPLAEIEESIFANLRLSNSKDNLS